MLSLVTQRLKNDGPIPVVVVTTIWIDRGSVIDELELDLPHLPAPHDAKGDGACEREKGDDHARRTHHGTEITLSGHLLGSFLKLSQALVIVVPSQYLVGRQRRIAQPRQHHDFVPPLHVLLLQ